MAERTTIRMSEQPPVRIDESEWPILAKTAHMTVRRSTKGKGILVYGSIADRWAGFHFLTSALTLEQEIETSHEVVRNIRRVAGITQASHEEVSKLIMQLPPIEL